MNKFFRYGLLPVCACLLLMQMSGCVVAFKHGDAGPKTYTKGAWLQKKAAAENQQRTLAARVAQAIDNDPLLSQANIDFGVTGTTVTLTGTLFDLDTYEHAINIVRNVKGVNTVNSEIELNLSR